VEVPLDPESVRVARRQDSEDGGPAAKKIPCSVLG